MDRGHTVDTTPEALTIPIQETSEWHTISATTQFHNPLHHFVRTAGSGGGGGGGGGARFFSHRRS